jgi:hypothetical protein
LLERERLSLADLDGGLELAGILPCECSSVDERVSIRE